MASTATPVPAGLAGPALGGAARRPERALSAASEAKDGDSADAAGDTRAAAGIAPGSVVMFVLMQLLGGVLAAGLVRFLYPHERPTR